MNHLYRARELSGECMPWVGENNYQNKKDMKKLTVHESIELFCMVALGMKYKPAHKIAEVADGTF